jgi:hypothetical protein
MKYPSLGFIKKKNSSLKSFPPPRPFFSTTQHRSRRRQRDPKAAPRPPSSDPVASPTSHTNVSTRRGMMIHGAAIDPRRRVIVGATVAETWYPSYEFLRILPYSFLAGQNSAPLSCPRSRRIFGCSSWNEAIFHMANRGTPSASVQLCRSGGFDPISCMHEFYKMVFLPFFIPTYDF